MRPIVSFCTSPTYYLSKHLCWLLTPLLRATDSAAKNLLYFMEMSKDWTIREDTYVVSLFTNVPTDLAIQVAKRRLEADDCIRSCGFQYVGETGQPLHHRINGHHFDIVHCQTDVTPVAAHFTSEGHSETNLSVIVIDVCWKEDTILRKIRESRWIRMLGTSWLSGLNLQTNGL